MDITLERIIQELKNQNKRQMDLTDFLGLTHNIFGNWKAGRNTSYKKYIHAIANYLGVSVEYLRGETDNKYPTDSGVSPPDELIKFALFGGDAETISDEAFEDVKRFAQIVAEKERRKRENGNNTP